MPLVNPEAPVTRTYPSLPSSVPAPRTGAVNLPGNPLGYHAPTPTPVQVAAHRGGAPATSTTAASVAAHQRGRETVTPSATSRQRTTVAQGFAYQSAAQAMVNVRATGATVTGAVGSPRTGYSAVIASKAPTSPVTLASYRAPARSGSSGVSGTPYPATSGGNAPLAPATPTAPQTLDLSGLNSSVSALNAAIANLAALEQAQQASTAQGGAQGGPTAPVTNAGGGMDTQTLAILALVGLGAVVFMKKGKRR